MNNRLLSGILFLFIITCMSGCLGGGAKQPFRSETHTRADTLLAWGVRAEQKGDREGAEKNFREAAAICASIEDNSLGARAYINLARLKRLQGNLDDAVLLAGKARTISTPGTEEHAEALQETAFIELAKGNIAAAKEMAEKAAATDSAENLGRRLNLLARILLLSGDSSTAAQHAEKALGLNRKTGEQEEEANSLRILGIAARKRGNAADSERVLLEAVVIDKRLGKASKIALDLEELALTLFQSGNDKQGIDYLQRAHDVNLNSGRVFQAAANLDKMAEVMVKNGKKEQAGELSAAAEKLRQKKQVNPAPTGRP